MTRTEALANLRTLEQLANGPPGSGELAGMKATLAALRSAAPTDIGALTKSVRHALAVWQSPRAWRRDGAARSHDRAQRALQRLRAVIETTWPENPE